MAEAAINNITKPNSNGICLIFYFTFLFNLAFFHSFARVNLAFFTGHSGVTFRSLSVDLAFSEL